MDEDFEEYCASTYLSCGTFASWCGDSGSDWVDQWDLWDNFACN